MDGSLKNHVFRNLGSRVLFMFFQAILYLLLPLLTSPETFGLASVLLANANFAVLLTSAGIPSLLSYQSATQSQSKSKINQVLIFSTLAQLMLILFAEGFSIISRGKFVIWPSENMLSGIIGILLFICIAHAEKLSAIFTGFLKADKFFFLSTIWGFVQVTLLTIWFLSKRPGPVIAPLYLLTAGQLFLVINLQFYFQRTPLVHVTNPQFSFDWRASWMYAFPAYVANLVQFLATRVDIWLVDYWFDKTQVGYYALSNQLGQILMLIPYVLASFAFPLLSSGKIHHRVFEKWIRLMNGILWIAVLLGFTLSPMLIRFLWNNTFNATITPFLLILPGFFARAQIAVYASYFAAKGSIKTNVLTSVIGLLCMLLADLILLPLWKIQGAAIGLTIAQILSAFWLITQYNNRTLSIGYRLWPLKDEWRNLHSIIRRNIPC